MLHPHHYDPNQPRVPKGHPDGGRWTDGGRGQDTILQSGQRTDGGHRRDTLVQLAFAPVAPAMVPPAIKAIEAGLALFAALSALNSRERRAVITFKAREYRRAGEYAFEFESMRVLKREEVKNICERLDDVQDLTDKGAIKVQGDAPFLTPTAYGTAVHKYVEEKINNAGPFDPRFRAEVSNLKSAEAAKQAKEAGRKDVARGMKDSIRIDVYEVVGNGTVCVYDIKTGDSVLRPGRMRALAKSIVVTEENDLTPARMGEILRKLREKGIPVVRIIVTQVKPTVPRVPGLR